MLENHINRTFGKYGVFEFFNSDVFIGRSIKEYGEYSDIELTIMLNFIKRNDVVFDIGSNIGAFTIPFAKRVGINGKVYGFEPQESIFELLKNNINNNRLENIEIFKKGIGLQKKNIFIQSLDYNKLGNFGGVSLKNENDEVAKIKLDKPKQRVEIIRLDEFINIKKCNFIKIDVEFMEIEVLKGGKKFLKKFRPIIWIENHGGYPNDLNKFLIKNEYKLYWVKSRLFNPNNFFLNQVNIFNQTCTQNVLAFPTEKDQNLYPKIFDKILDENTKPHKVFVQI